MFEKKKNSLPENRRGELRRQLSEQGPIVLCEAHNGLSTMISENAVSTTGQTFDGHWVSSLTCSASRGLPDMEIYVAERRLEMIEEICFASGKIVMVDADTGGDAVCLEYFVRKLEILGVSAVVVEDKRHPKRNSLDGTELDHLEDPTVFARKISRAKSAMATDEMMFISRLESLVAGGDLSDALARAETYIEAGTDGIMIHSKSSNPDEVFAFAEAFKKLQEKLDRHIPLMCVPTTYNNVGVHELFERGFDIIVHANHLLRAAHLAMSSTCQRLLESGMSGVLDNNITPVKELFAQTGYYAAIERDTQI
ncbi:isocitrate lyase/phosphoenolpyruvate mutase family protein [Thioclava sp.]|uniref:isocitrate lyase/phosphoenolpyruvate mutase family protein n=1 Tax=Thioclava sp. TaxID=1933450 RepID=UPI003AA87656